MKKGTRVFLLTLVLFACGTSAIAFTLAKDASGPATGGRKAPVVIPWYCVKNTPPSGSVTITVPPIGTIGTSVQPVPTIAIGNNPGRTRRAPPIVIKRKTVPQKITKPDLSTPPPRTPPPSETPGYSAPGGTPGYYPSGSTRTPGGSTITKNGPGGIPSPSGYYGSNGGGSGNGPGFDLKLGPNDNASDPGIWDSEEANKIMQSCPEGYHQEVDWSGCYQLLKKKLAGQITDHDMQSPLYALCSQVIKPAVWNTKITPELCTAYNKYSQECNASKGASCPLQSFIEEAGIPMSQLQKTLQDANKYCWIF